ncbi:exopolysaccharide transport family protein [Mesorhizobium sp. VK25A]|uniref:Exopolysaccharide transport family protein n=1 Tax=Mesorhizobium vachelliae TaxID=3072309 RepID=A0ABU5A8R6_9HYPH|nr:MULTISPECIES: exopolysaccharide transport family protein [unclassified Mesorhizobium]MDX8534093.1 exopolysaccharide transport family protein [Mesorhizobium sp. VK25D]MDX8548396.1 exopolysaccharide transport family protein [Mesorhizobium sp. VK25A]
MEGSIVSRIHLPRTTETRVAVREPNPRMRRQLREPGDAQTPFNQLWITIARRKWFLLAMAILGGVVAAIVGFSRPTQFEATTQIIVEAAARSTPDGTGGQDMLDTSIDNHLTMLTSLENMRRVVAALGKVRSQAPNNPSNGAGQDVTAVPPAKKLSAADGLLDWIWGQGGQSKLSPEAAEAADLKALRRGVRVGQELRSRVITVGFTDTDPARAALVANTFAQVYVDDLASDSQAADKMELSSVVAALPKLQSDLAQATDRLEEYRLSHGTVDQGAMDNAAREAADLNQQISLSKADLAAVESRLAQIKDLQASGAAGASLAEAIGSPTLAEIVARQVKAPADQDLGIAVKREIEEGIARISTEADIYRAQVAALEARKNVLDAVVADTAGRVSGLRALEPTVAILTQRYNELLARQQDLTRRIANPSPGVSIISTAWPPTVPKSLSPVYFIPPGMVLFCLIGGILALVSTRLDQTLRGEAEAEAALGFPCIGLLPKVPGLRARRLRNLILAQKNSTYGRAALSLAVNAASEPAAGRTSQIVLVTSSGKNDGKTELAWSLALSATRLGGNVLFIDLDPQDARLTNDFVSEFGVSKPGKSFEDYVRSRCNLDDAIVSMPEIGIDFMAAPIVSDDLLKLLFEVDEPRHFADRLGAAYNLVILNGLPGLEGPESRLLTSWVDSVVFAVRWAKTPRSIARGILVSLQPDGAGSVPVGIALTDVNLKQHAKYHFGDSGDLLLVGNR